LVLTRRVARTTDTSAVYALSLHDALPLFVREAMEAAGVRITPDAVQFLSDRLGSDRMASRTEIDKLTLLAGPGGRIDLETAMEEIGKHTSELQSRENLVCRLLHEKKKHKT